MKKSPTLVTLEYEKMKCLERAWSSSNANELTSFYRLSTSEFELVEFMRNRQPSTFESDIFNQREIPDIVFVVPTADFDGTNARKIRETLSGETIVFVQSSGQFFNYSRSCNYGIKIASKMSPEWIVVCNDDVNFDGKSKEIRNALLRERFSHFMVPKNARHFVIVKPNVLTHLLSILETIISGELSSLRAQLIIIKSGFKFYQIMIKTRVPIFFSLISNTAKRIIEDTRLGEYFLAGRTAVWRNFSFDENFINGVEDVDLMLRIFRSSFNLGIMQINIDQVGGSTFLRSETWQIRKIRKYINAIYLWSKWYMLR